MPVTRVWLTRHAESANPIVFHGAESDIELGERGHAQAHAVVDWVASQRPTMVVTSAMRRAIQTAEPAVKQLQLPHVIVPEFHERRMGKLGGTSFDLSSGPWVDTLRHWHAGDTSYTTEGAESFDELRDRLIPAFQQLTARYSGERILLITHGVVVKVLLLCLLPGWGPHRWTELGRVHNLCMSELESTTDGWHANTLLQVPPPVAALGVQESPQQHVIKSEG